MSGAWLDPGTAAHWMRTGTDAFRIFEGAGCWIDWLAGRALISAPDPTGVEALRKEISTWARTGDLEPPSAVYFRQLVTGPGGASLPVLVDGREETTAFAVREEGIRFEVDLRRGYSSGLFLDQRLNRLRIRASKAKKILNCFAYTCSFSVAAAIGGAVSTNIDIARRALDTGRRNFELNDMACDGHRFFCEDVRACLPRLARRGERFDLVVLDPPTFARGAGGRVFQVARELGGLLRQVLELVGRDFQILLSTNCASLPVPALRRLAQTEIRRAGVACRIEDGRLPEGFHGTGCSSTLWIRSANFTG